MHLFFKIYIQILKKYPQIRMENTVDPCYYLEKEMRWLMKRKAKRLRLVWQFGKRYWPLFLLAEICILVSYTVSLLLPLNLTLLTDQVLYGGNHALLGQVIQN